MKIITKMLLTIMIRRKNRRIRARLLSMSQCIKLARNSKVINRKNKNRSLRPTRSKTSSTLWCTGSKLIELLDPRFNH
jgi:hypothetical protein